MEDNWSAKNFKAKENIPILVKRKRSSSENAMTLAIPTQKITAANGWKVTNKCEGSITSEKENCLADYSLELVSKVESDQNKPDKLCVKLSYKHAASYWSNVPATEDGMLGGFAHISRTDIIGSSSFLKWLFGQRIDKLGHGRCVDCGAGIGRITKKLLQRHFGKVDLVEQCPVFADKAREIFSDNNKIGDIFCLGLQDFAPSSPIYDVVWVQWVIIYLPDHDLIDFFRRMAQALKKDGVIVVKDNFTTGSVDDPAETIVDEEDSSVTRPLDHVLQLARDAGLKLVKSTLQKKFPKELFKVYMLAFRPSQYSTMS